MLRGIRCENRMQKRLEIVRAAHQMRRGEPTARGRENRKNDQRNRHVPRRFEDMHFVLVETWLAKKWKKDQAKHIKRRQPRSDQAQSPQPHVRMRAGARGV